MRDFNAIMKEDGAKTQRGDNIHGFFIYMGEALNEIDSLTKGFTVNTPKFLDAPTFAKQLETLLKSCDEIKCCLESIPPDVLKGNSEVEIFSQKQLKAVSFKEESDEFTVEAMLIHCFLGIVDDATMFQFDVYFQSFFECFLNNYIEPPNWLDIQIYDYPGQIELLRKEIRKYYFYTYTKYGEVDRYENYVDKKVDQIIELNTRIYTFYEELTKTITIFSKSIFKKREITSRAFEEYMKTLRKLEKENITNEEYSEIITDVLGLDRDKGEFQCLKQ